MFNISDGNALRPGLLCLSCLIGLHALKTEFPECQPREFLHLNSFSFAIAEKPAMVAFSNFVDDV